MDKQMVVKKFEELADAVGALRDAVFADEVLEGPGAQYTLYNQRDPKWAAQRLGTSNTTIGSDGCLLTAYASAMSDAGKVITPDALNIWLTANGGYANGNRFIFAAPDKLGVLKFESLVDYQNPAPINKINDYINAGGFVLVQVDFNPDRAMQPHWCRYIGGGEVIDPWYGDIAKLTPRYRGKDAAEAIWRAAYYRKV